MNSDAKNVVFYTKKRSGDFWSLAIRERRFFLEEAWERPGRRCGADVGSGGRERRSGAEERERRSGAEVVSGGEGAEVR